MLLAIPTKSNINACLPEISAASLRKGTELKRHLAFGLLEAPLNPSILLASPRTVVTFQVVGRAVGLPSQLRGTSEDFGSPKTRQRRSRTSDKDLASGSSRSWALVQDDSHRVPTDQMRDDDRRVSWQNWAVRFELRKAHPGQGREISRNRRVNGWGSVSKPPRGRHVFSMARAKHLSPL